MLLCFKSNEYTENNVIINKKIKNNVMTDSYFYRIYYSDKNIILNGISVDFEINTFTVEKYFSKIKISFNRKTNEEIINNIINIEQSLLDMLNIRNKTRKTLLKEQLDNNSIKIISNEDTIDNTSYINLGIKISGFWETRYEYGIAFRCNLLGIVT